MSISNAMQSGVAGLFANSHKLGRIADNIANANTVGYKRSFVDMVSLTATGAGSKAVQSSVRSVERTEVDRQGSPLATATATDLAVVGGGFFVASKDPLGAQSSDFVLTRAGSFRPNEDGYLVNSAGYHLFGFPYGADGSLTVGDRNSFSSLQAVKVGDVAMTGSPTTTIGFSGNLPAQQTGLAVPPSAFVSSKEFFSPLGVSQRLNFNWQASATPNTWTLSVTDPAGTTYGSVDVEFNDSGPNAGSPATYSNVVNSALPPALFAFDPLAGRATLTIDNGTVPQVIDVDFGAPGSFTGITQFAGDYAPSMSGDGAASGSLTRVEFADNGTMYGVFDSGVRKALFQIPLGSVANPNGLGRADGNAFRLTKEAGEFALRDAKSGNMGYVASGSLERSNVDIAEELTSLIETQRSYSSNAKTVQTADEMMEETTRLKR